MCGIAGYTGAERADRATLQAALWGAARRGPDALGAVAYVAGGTVLRRELAPDRPRAVRELVDHVAGARRLLAHFRLATSGACHDPRNVQPLAFSWGYLAHNGNVRDSAAIARRLGIRLETGVDSEVIGALLSHGIVRTLASAFGLVDDGSPVALVALLGERLLAFRRGHPLSLYRSPEGGTYLSSSLPESWSTERLPEEEWIELA